MAASGRGGSRDVGWIVAAAGLAIGLVVLAARGTQPSRTKWTKSPEGRVQPHLSRVPLPETFPPRGRDAGHPRDIPARGWWAILRRTWAAVEEDRVLAVAAGVTFYLLLAMVPAITAFVSLYGLFARRETVVSHLDALAGIVPAETMPVISEQMIRIASAGEGAMSVASVIALLVAVWSATGGTRAMIDALNVAYDERETRSFVRLVLLSVAMTGGAGILGLFMISAIAVLPAVLSFVPNAGIAAQLALWLRWPLLAGVMLIGLSVLYRFGPDRATARWRWVNVGATAATLALIPFSLGFSFYASRFADFNATYGSLGAVMGLLLWFWLSSVIVLMGAEINSEAEKQTNRDTTTGTALPMGLRRAEAADAVAYDETGN